MLKFIFICFFVFGSNISLACEKDLISLLNTAKKTVTANFKKGEPCYNAALIGRTKGKPGCFPPGALQLQSLLTPTFKSAEKVCQSSCRAEAKLQSCQSLIAQSNLKQLGINGLMEILNNKGLTSTASSSEKVEEEVPVEI